MAFQFKFPDLSELQKNGLNIFLKTGYYKNHKFMGFIKELMNMVFKNKKVVSVALVLAITIGIEATGKFHKYLPTITALAVMTFVLLIIELTKAINLRGIKSPWETFSDSFIESLKTDNLENLFFDINPDMDKDIDRILGSKAEDRKNTIRERLISFFQEIFIPRILYYDEIIQPLKQKAFRNLIMIFIVTGISGFILFHILLLVFNIIYYQERTIKTLLIPFTTLIPIEAYAWSLIKRFYAIYEDIGFYQEKMAIAEAKYMELETSLKTKNSKDIIKSLERLITTDRRQTIKLKKPDNRY